MTRENERTPNNKGRPQASQSDARDGGDSPERKRNSEAPTPADAPTSASTSDPAIRSARRNREIPRRLFPWKRRRRIAIRQRARFRESLAKRKLKISSSEGPNRRLRAPIKTRRKKPTSARTNIPNKARSETNPKTDAGANARRKASPSARRGVRSAKVEPVVSGEAIAIEEAIGIRRSKSRPLGKTQSVGKACF